MKVRVGSLVRCYQCAEPRYGGRLVKVVVNLKYLDEWGLGCGHMPRKELVVNARN